MKRPFQRRGESVTIRLGDDLGPGLAYLIDLLDNLGEPATDPAAARLEVPVYLGEPEAEEAWRAEHADRLDAGRAADRAVFRRVIGPNETVVSRDDAVSLLRVLVELRLVVGARMGVEIETDYERLSDEQANLLGVLGWLLEELIGVIGV